MMSAREDRRLLNVSIAFIVGLVAIGIIVANIRYLDLGEGLQGAGPEIREITTSLMYALAVIWIALFVVYILRHRVISRTQGAKDRGKANYLIALLIIGALLLASLFVNQNQYQEQNQNPSDNGTIPNGVDNNPISGDATGGMGALFVLIAVLAVALTLVALKHNRPTTLRIGKAPLAFARQNAEEAIRKAAKDLFAGEDPRSVIVRTYQQMSRLLEKEERSLKPLTPREVAELARLDFGWPESQLNELTSLFEEAWYSQHAIGEAQRERALQAFEAIVSKENERRPEPGRTNT